MPGPKSDKAWSDAMRRAVSRESAGKGSPKWLHVIADRVVQLAAEGDMTAVKEIGDRLDGKPAQVHAGDQDKPIRLINAIERVIVDPRTPETPDS